MRGQLKYSYMFGLLIFLFGIILGAKTIYRMFPIYASKVRQKNLDLETDSLISLISEDPGYWENGGNGTDWENHLPNVERIGLGEDGVLNESKINKAENLSHSNYTRFKEKLGLTKKSVFIKIVYESVPENCSIADWKGWINGTEVLCCRNLSKVKCMGPRPTGKTKMKEREVFIRGKETARLRVVVW